MGVAQTEEAAPSSIGTEPTESKPGPCLLCSHCRRRVTLEEESLKPGTPPPFSRGKATLANPAAALTEPAPRLRRENINPRVVEAEYAVRGAIVARAAEIETELANGVKKPFDKVLYCNIGNPQQLGAQPITFFRQVLALCDHPGLLDHPKVGELFPEDVLTRARTYLNAIAGGTGAYSASNGAAICREHVAQGITLRDGVASDPSKIFLTDGASPAVHYLMKLLVRSPEDGIMVPIPQYPLYSASLALHGGALVPYYLDENSGWGMSIPELRESLSVARAQGKCVRALAVINPGNPTGQCLTKENQEEVLRFCKEEGLVLIADEVYQDNVYADNKEFNSFKSVVARMGAEFEHVPVASLHSISKGFYGECGRRGGYMEVFGFEDCVLEEMLKLASINLCPNINGQICVALMMNPPRVGEPSYELYAQERDAHLGSLRRRANLIYEGLNALEGVSCQRPEGALYAFPSITIPAKAAMEAAAMDRQPDFEYCMQLLEATGIVAVPGSGFQQAPGTFHFRCTILPPEDDIADVVAKLTAFHEDYMRRYA